jgi:hypothetical protein
MYLSSALNNLETVIRFLNKQCVKTQSEKIEYNSNWNIEWNKLKKQPFFKKLLDETKNEPEVTKQRLIAQLLKRLPFLNAIRENVEQTIREKKKTDENGNIIIGKNGNPEILDYWNAEQPQLTAEDYAHILEYYGQLLANLRHFYTHIDHLPVRFALNEENQSFQRYQRNILHVLTAALRETKKHFNYPAPQENNNVDELLHLRRYNGVSRSTQQEYDNYQKRRAEGKLDLLEMPVFGDVKRGSYSKMKDNPNCRFFEKHNGEYIFTERGLAFFTAWFLQSEEIEKMFQKIKPTAFEKDRRTKEFIATKRVFSALHIRLPKTRIESVEKILPDTLGMDIITELHKVPATVWNYLSGKDQMRVREFANKFDDIIEQTQTSNENNTHNNNETADTDFSGKRIKNRFTYFALSYFDVTETFSQIRFQIDWGNYVFNSYLKKTIDGSILPDRQLQKRIYSFERIQDAYKWFSKNRGEQGTLYYEVSPEKETPKEYRIPMLPQYNINTKKNHIGITFETVTQPELTGKTTKRYKPDAVLNLSDLPVLLFLAVHGQAEKAQKKLRNYYKNWRQFLQDIKERKPVNIEYCNKNGIVLSDLPLEFRRFIETGKTSAPKETQLMKVKLQRILDKTVYDLKRFKEECKTDFKPGGKRKQHFKAGDIGSYLAHDLVKLQCPNYNKPHQGKITSVNFEALQVALATFSTTKGTLQDIFKKAGFIENPEYPHPFLNELVDARGVKALTLQSFFKNYLERKVTYIKNCQSGKESTYLFDSLQRKAERKQQPDYIQQLAEKYLNEPLVFPKQLLDPIVTEFVKTEFAQKYAEKEKETIKKGKEMNTTFLIMRYHQWKFGDSTQWFYVLPHGIESEALKKITNILKVKISKKTNKNTNYVGLFDKVQQQLYNQWEAITTTERNGKKPVLLIELNKIRKEFKRQCRGAVYSRGEQVDYREKFTQLANRIQRQEEKVPKIKLQDIVLFHTAYQLLNITGQVKLSDIQENKPYLLGQDERSFSKTYNIPVTADKKENKKFPVTITGKMKIKNYGNFNRRTNDPRIPSLLRLLTKANATDTVDYEHLRKELDLFDRKQKDIFQWVHKFETAVKQKYPAECKAKRKNNYIDFLSYCEVLIDKGELTLGQALALLQIGDGFSHNYFPEFEHIERDDLSSEQNATANVFFDKLRQQLIGKSLVSEELMMNRVLNVLKTLQPEILL